MSFISIPIEEYKKLLDDSEFLGALRAAGVDNWDGYDYALELMDDDEEPEDEPEVEGPLV